MNKKKELLQSKTVLITGATSGIGLQLAKDYLDNDWNVIACGRNTSVLDLLTDANNQKFTIKNQLTPFAFDVTNRDQVHQAAKQLDNDGDCQCDLIILNAGNCEYINDAINFDDQKFERVITTNLISMGYCLAAFTPLVKKHGRVALMGSSASFLPLPRSEAYGASKAAIAYLADSLRIDLHQQLYVSTIFPGFVKTPLTDKNNFPMPARINVKQAARIIRHQLEKGKSHIHFPKRLTLTMKFFSLLPSSWWQKIASSLLRQH